MNMKLGYQLLLSYIVLAIIPTYSIGYYSYTTSVNALQNETTLRLQGTLQQIQNNIAYKQNEMERTVEQLYYDQGFQAAIYNYTNGWEGYLTITQNVLPRLSSALALASYDVNLVTYINDPSFPEVRYPVSGNPLSRGKRAEISLIDRFSDEQWLNTVSEETLIRGVWMQTPVDKKYGNISYFRELLYFQTGTRLGVLQVTASVQDVFAAIEDAHVGEGSEIVVSDISNKVQLLAGTQISIADWKLRGSDTLTVTATVPNLKWHVNTYVPLSTIRGESDNIRNITFLICALVFFCLLLLGWGISQHISRRINRIIVAFRALQIGDFRRRIPDKQGDELCEIENAFNEMANNLGTLVQEVYINKIKQKEAQLNMLQAQINPHFLYNTLSAISRLAKMGESDKLQKMLLSLARFYRLSLNNGRTIVTVEEELQQVQTYLDIQKIKHSNDIEVRFDVDPQALPYITLKLTLQPFVENAITHARFIHTIHIRIVVEKQGTNIVFQVIDDGIGMDDDMLTRLKTEAGHYGIQNVDQRIQLQFGDAYGVSIYSAFGIGTTVQLVIPAQLQEEKHPEPTISFQR
ncbi:cache domain-containing sensor histidine kinase [Tengunoibacter tsumagoiensis]|uniref:Histidine kinase n=1 Tax=Tengunoibacter tsumagoiensis TaxID=2014871 RepID=A0A402A947_9CHLR|nr:histidine kinase [Tengunoibacter tsumagoiensis]GCE15485.1 histidine kinase [Tengunoibacter tsumagoiensis]